MGWIQDMYWHGSLAKKSDAPAKNSSIGKIQSNVPKPAMDGVINMDDFAKQMTRMGQSKIGPSQTTGGDFGFVAASGAGPSPAMQDPVTGRATGLIAPGGGGSSGGGGGSTGLRGGSSSTGSSSTSRGFGATGVRAKAATMARGSMPAGRIVSMKSTGSSGPSAQQKKLIADLSAQLQAGSKSANAAGKARYQKLLRQIAGLKEGILGEGGTLAQAEGQMSEFGQTGQRQIQQDLLRQLAGSEQDLITRGLGNTTVRSSVRRGIQSDAEQARQSLGERVATQKAGLLERKAGMQADLGRLESDAILSREDTGPDMGMYLSLIQALTSM